MKADLDIIKDCLNGDQLAYKAIYQRYVGYCYGICKRYGLKNSEIKDQIQITFIEVFKSLERYQSDKAGFKTWLTRICINQIINQKRKYWENVYMEELSDVHDQLKQHIVEPQYGAIDKEYILQVLSRMPEKYRAVFNLFIIDGYSHNEISEQLNISESSSRVILNRARKWAQQAITSTLKQS